jgi:hypothetical protein
MFWRLCLRLFLYSVLRSYTLQVCYILSQDEQTPTPPYAVQSMQYVFLDAEKNECKVVPVLNWAPQHKGVWGSGCIDPRFPDLGTSWRWSVSFTPPVPIWYEVGWALEPVWPIERSNNSLPYLYSNSDSPVVHPVGSRYTGYATAPHRKREYNIFYNTFIHSLGIGTCFEVFNKRRFKQQCAVRDWAALSGLLRTLRAGDGVVVSRRRWKEPSSSAISATTNPTRCHLWWNLRSQRELQHLGTHRFSFKWLYNFIGNKNVTVHLSLSQRCNSPLFIAVHLSLSQQSNWPLFIGVHLPLPQQSNWPLFIGFHLPLSQ